MKYVVLGIFWYVEYILTFLFGVFMSLYYRSQSPSWKI